jgi:lipid-A-disaccharide synthase|tara:strand:+ start:1693 stop:2829 length:1137 start_codon:yes stop_codon:yes gene_type:complete
MSKKIFIVTGEPSGDRLASKAISRLKKINNNIEFLSVGGTYLKSIGVDSIFDLKKITYLGFTRVILNIFKIRRKINQTVDKILEFNPDILFSVDSPDFTLRVAKLVKKKKPNIKTIHYVAPQVWIWRESRVKKIKNFIDHILLLFNFEKKYFDKENIKSTFVGHPLLDNDDKIKIDLAHLNSCDKKIISIFPGSRLSEINILMPILIQFIQLMDNKYDGFLYVFHVTQEYKNLINQYLIKSNLNNFDIVSDENIKVSILAKSFFAIAKSGTISLEICKAGIPSIIIYKMNFINFFIVKLLIKVRFANIINIINDSEIIPELLQSNCNSNNIYKHVKSFITNPELGRIQVINYQKILKEIKSNTSSVEKVSKILNENLN